MADLKLPDALEEILIQAGEDIDSNYWKLGDITADLVDELNGQYKKTEVRSAVARTARIAVETVRDQERMSRRIPVGKRTYALSRHQYRACMGAGDAWETFAQRAVESADDYGGRPAPVEVIRGWVHNDVGEQESIWFKRWDRFVDLAEWLTEAPESPDLIKKIAWEVINADAGLAAAEVGP